MIKQVFVLFAAVGFLPLSICSSCTNAPMMVESVRMYETKQAGFSQAVIVNNLLVTSGTVGWKSNRAELPSSFQGQLDSVFVNLQHLAKEANSSLHEAVLFRFYVVNLDTAKRKAVSKKLQEVFPKEYKPASSLIGVAALANQKLLIEVEMISKINKTRPQ